MIENIEFTVTGENFSQTLKTNADGELVLKDLVPGEYTVTETPDERYEEQQPQVVKVEMEKTAAVTFRNVLKKCNLKIVKKLEGALPILAQVNLDGNCYVITLISVLVLLQNGIYPKWFEIAMIGILIFVLSLGAPNQPGSCLIGFTTVLAYLQTYSLLHMVIISEVMYGSMINLINVTGDLVTVAIENADRKKGRTTG